MPPPVKAAMLRPAAIFSRRQDNDFLFESYLLRRPRAQQKTICLSKSGLPKDKVNY
jgi:hypothetical protein